MNNCQTNIEGLQYIPNFITEDEENELIDFIDSQEWDTSLSRRTQHYGWRYDYKSKKLDISNYLGELPDIFKTLGEKLVEEKLIDFLPQQVIVNEYVSGQGIGAHTDSPVFGEYIVSISLLSAVPMVFVNRNRTDTQTLVLERRCALSMSGKARHEYTHQINGRHTDILGERGRVRRSRRVSITFRTKK